MVYRDRQGGRPTYRPIDRDRDRDRDMDIDRDRDRDMDRQTI